MFYQGVMHNAMPQCRQRLTVVSTIHRPFKITQWPIRELLRSRHAGSIFAYRFVVGRIRIAGSTIWIPVIGYAAVVVFQVVYSPCREGGGINLLVTE